MDSRGSFRLVINLIRIE